MRHVGGMDDADATLPLFEGAHIPRIRFENALERLDLRAALADAPAALREAVAAMAAAVGDKGPAHADLDALVRCRSADWPVRPARQRSVCSTRSFCARIVGL
jgi:hypothetical protein